jgi:hypothetical protein
MSGPTSVEDLADLLRRCLIASDALDRQRLLRQFQVSIWESEGTTGDNRVDDILVTAAHDLDFYEPRDDWRAEDVSFYDDHELDTRLRSILRDLGQPEVHDA